MYQVNDAGLSVEDSSGKTLDAQYIPMDNVTSNLRSFYTKAYLGISSLQIPKYWLVFKATVPPLGWNTFFISKASAQGMERQAHANCKNFHSKLNMCLSLMIHFLVSFNDIGSSNHTHSSVMLSPVKNTTEIGPGNVKMVFSSDSGRLERMYNSRTGVMFRLLLHTETFWFINLGNLVRQKFNHTCF